VNFSHVPTLRSLYLLDTPAEPAFDRLTEVAAMALRVPIALLSLIDEHRQFFKSACGLPEPLSETRETPLSHSFCKHVAYDNDALIIEDARENPLVKDNPAVTELGVIAYAGMPVRDENGTAIGALCAIGTEPKKWTRDELDTLRLLAEQASVEISLRTKTARLGVDLANCHAAEERRRHIAELTRHDLGTPLNAILLHLAAVSKIGPVNDEQRECLATAERNCAAVLTILRRMLDSED